MDLHFYIDPETGHPHIHGHGVGEQEVRDVLLSTREDRSGRYESRVAIGQTRGGRYLRVIYKRDPDEDCVFVITAYELTGKPLSAFRRRIRRRSG